jgi:ferrous-iron efflux pump FieF
MERYTRLAKLATLASVLVALILIVLKTIAYLATGSMSMLGSLLDSSMDGITSLVNFMAVRYASAPADEEHRFGHGKAESLAALIQAAFLCGSAFMLVLTSIDVLSDPKPIEHSMSGIIISVIAILLTLALVVFQQFVVKETNSLVVEADALHYKGDLLMNGAVIFALFMSSQGFGWIDVLCALAIAIYLLINAWQLAGKAWQDLMDRELGPEVEQHIRDMVRDLPGCLGCHDIRTRQAGPQRFIQLHLELDGSLSLTQAHAIGLRLEQSLLAEYPLAEVMIHHDPVNRSAP